MASSASLASTTARHLAHLSRRYPVSTLGLATTGTALSYGAYLEYSANSSSSEGDNLLRLPRSYDATAISTYWTSRPLSVSYRVCQIASELGPLLLSALVDSQLRREKLTSDAQLQRRYATELKAALTRLGPAFVKAGQQLSIRPDLIPPAVLKELTKLCDAVDPVDDEVALKLLREELGAAAGNISVESTFEGIHLVASASLGQVYKAKLKATGQEVAIKVQRPDMISSVSLDLFLLRHVAWLMDGITSCFTHQAPFHEGLVRTFAEGSYLELDYENEASNQRSFKTDMASRKCQVYIPAVYDEFTTRKVLTTEWINGVKLADAPQEQIRELIPVGVELFLTQLLDTGKFHADPHPGNLFVTEDGKLCLLDFGLCATVDEHDRLAMTAAIVHILTGDFDTLISQDAKTLGFLPPDLDTSDLQPLLTKILTEGLLESGSNLHERKRKLMDISNELNEVFFRYPFSVPPFFALVTRGLGLLEGIALSGDPTFDIFQASYPYARRRAVEIFGSHGYNRMWHRMPTLRRIGSSATTAAVASTGSAGHATTTGGGPVI